MRESGDRLQSALYSSDFHEQLVAGRVYESPAAYQAWESEHAELMRKVANTGLMRTQAALLKKTAFQLIHRKALFEYLRDKQVRGNLRQRVVVYFHPTKDYAQSVVNEHGQYLRNSCSLLCTSHVGGNVVHDSGFFDPLIRYQELYAEYFQIFCDWQFGTDSDDIEVQRELLPLLKYQLEECRAAIMNLQPESQRLKREAAMREPTGDTVRLPRLGAFTRKP
jgi:hypothetical protein